MWVEVQGLHDVAQARHRREAAQVARKPVKSGAGEAQGNSG